MGVGRTPEPAPAYSDRVRFRLLTALEIELTALVQRMEAEVADGGAITVKSAGELHDLRVEAERLLAGAAAGNLH